MDLERELTALAAEIEWPATPELVLSLPSVVATPRQMWWRRQATPRRHLVPALALLVVAVAAAAAFAVPQSRGAILRFLHLRGATIELVDRLPPAQERPLSAGLGAVVDRDVASAQLVGGLVLPPLSPLPPLHSDGHVVSLLFREHGSPVLLSELYAPGGYFLKKVAATGTRVRYVRIGSDQGIWLEGAPHVFVVPDAPPRLAGNVLLWSHGNLLLRLEGRNLTLAHALDLTQTLR